MNSFKVKPVILLMMQVAAFTLALVVTAVQTVGWVECCCILICRHRNDPCGDCKEKARPELPRDCCKKETQSPRSQPSGKSKRCAHVEPSSEVVALAGDLPPATFEILLELPVAAPLQVPANPGKTDSSCGRARGSPPLHLLYSVLLI
jgi:hypothetical protein